MTILFFYYPPLLFISYVLSFFFPTMMTFYKKSVHSFLALTPYFHHHATENNLNNNLAFKYHNPNPFCTVGSLGLPGNAATGGDHDDGAPKPNNDIHTVESARAWISLSLSSPSPLPSLSMLANRHTDEIGFVDDIVVDGLMSCTESLGFESTDERGVFLDHQMGDMTMSTSTRDGCGQDVYCWKRSRSGEHKSRWNKVGREVKKFPPPLSSLNVNGKPSSFLHPVRKDGRLQLTEVRIQRKEVLRASRQDGRLRLHLVRDEDALDFLHQQQQSQEQIGGEEEDEIVQQDIEKEEKKQGEVVEQRNEEEEKGQEEDDGAGDDDEEVKVVVNEQVRRVGEWKFRVSGEGLSRCYGIVNHYQQHHHNRHHPFQYHSNHHNHFLVWRQHCLTTG